MTDIDNRNLFLAVEEFEFSVRVANTLLHHGIEYVGELVQKTENDLLRTKHFGRKSGKEVRDALAALVPPLHLGMKIENFPAMLKQWRAEHGSVEVAKPPKPANTLVPRVLVDLTVAQRNVDSSIKRALDRIASIEREIVALQAERDAINEALKTAGRSK
jgi:hypothetical protein